LDPHSNSLFGQVSTAHQCSPARCRTLYPIHLPRAALPDQTDPKSSTRHSAALGLTFRTRRPAMRSVRWLVGSSGWSPLLECRPERDKSPANCGGLLDLTTGRSRAAKGALPGSATGSGRRTGTSACSASSAARRGLLRNECRAAQVSMGAGRPRRSPRTADL